MFAHSESRNRGRGWRWLAVAVVSVLVASVLSVVAGAPVQAANTSAEDKQDTNNDNVGDARWFAGAHRYETAERLARKFAADQGGVSSVIIASGVSQVDAVTAAGLAGDMDAPVLLTRPNMVPHGVQRFINEQNIASITIVGGTAAVSAAVETTLRGLTPKPTVRRLAGANRYATAAMIGSSLGGPSPTWCGSTQPAAILVNGVAEGWPEAIVAGPLAYRLGLPILLTRADELPAETRSFIDDNNVDRVMVVGGSEAVTDELLNSLINDVGVTFAPRIGGDSAAATSVAVAEEMLDACADVLNVDRGRVALVNRDSTPDGVAASPVLGRGMGATGAIPILLVGDELPAEVRTFLAGTPEVRNGRKTHMSIVAVGGTAAVSEKVMNDAVAAAKTSPELTATISFNPKTPTKFKVTFSDDVLTADNLTTGSVRERFGQTNAYSGAHVEDPALYRVNDRRLSAESSNQGGTNEGARGASNLLLQSREVTVTLATALEDGDVVEVVGGGKVGANGDRRPLVGAKRTIERPAAAADTAAPVVEIIAVASTEGTSGTYEANDKFDIIVTEPNLLNGGNGNPFIAEGGIRVIPCPTCGDKAVSISSAGISAPVTGARVGRPGSDGQGKGLTRFTITWTDRTNPSVNRLQVGDVIEVKRGTFLDTGNRGNNLTRYTVKAPRQGSFFGTFETSSISIGNKTPTKSAVATIETGGTNTPQDDIKVTALSTGIAAGSAGNAWRIFGYELPSASRSKPVDIAVEVDPVHKTITYTVRNGRARVIDLARAFARDATFAANFRLDYADNAQNPVPTTALGGISATPVKFGGTVATWGVSAIAVRVDFNDVIEGYNPDRLAGAIIGREGLPPDPAGADDGLTADYGFVAPDRSVWITYKSRELTNLTKLPVRAGTRVIFGQGNEIAHNFHNTTAMMCGPFGRTCPPGQRANDAMSDDLKGSLHPGLRLDPSLKTHGDLGAAPTCQFGGTWPNCDPPPTDS